MVFRLFGNTTDSTETALEKANSPISISPSSKRISVASAHAANAKLPMDQRRYLIVDRIPEAEELDVMYIEVDYERYLDWARQYIAAYRNRKAGKKYAVLSLDAPNPIDETLTMHDCIASSVNVEQEAIENADIDKINITSSIQIKEVI